MPLLDHFRGVQRERRNPSAFLSAWATFLASQINSMLPIGYFAESNVQFGIEIDVALGQALPTVPLCLRGGRILPLDLEESYGPARNTDSGRSWADLTTARPVPARM
jgi:hypothetical protein